MNCLKIRGFFSAAILIAGLLTPPCSAEDRVIVKNGDTIAFLGDSITAGGANYGRYCRLVIHGLKTKGINAKGVFAGVPGNKSSDMLLRLDGVLRHKPEHLFLACGVNDIWHGAPDVRIGVFQAPHEGMGVSLEHYTVYVKEIVDRCDAAGTSVILSTITPIKEDPEFKLNKVSEKYNAFLYELAKEKQLPIARLNEAMFARIAELKAEQGGSTRRNMLTSDGVHPGAEGHQVMAKGVLKAMGLSDEELVACEKEWKSSPRLMLIGDRQVSSGGRGGGWVHMLLDCLNSRREMVTTKSIIQKEAKLADLMPRVAEAIVEGRIKYALVIPPLGDVIEGTEKDEYRRAVESLISMLSGKDRMVAVATIPLQKREDIDKRLRGYNKVISSVCAAKKVPLVDISRAMNEYYTENSAGRLTLGDERLNHQGGLMLAGNAYLALEGEAEVLEALKPVWAERGSYTFKYDRAVHFRVSLSEKGKQALADISERYHRLDSGKILRFGVHELLYGDLEDNHKRYRLAQKEWMIDGAAEGGLKLRAIPASENELRDIQLQLKRNRTSDMAGFYKRAFLTGMHVLRKEDPLGRGIY